MKVSKRWVVFHIVFNAQIIWASFLYSYRSILFLFPLSIVVGMIVFLIFLKEDL